MKNNMHAIFQQPHIFVVFFPGSSGNFISSLIHCLLDGRANNITIAESGHAHNNSVNEKKLQGTDFLCLGSGIASQLKFESSTDKLEYYKEKILSSDYDATKRYVTWTHDYLNIPLYNFLFPNAKILTISSNSLNEKLIATVLRINKNIFSVDKNLPFSKDEVLFIKNIKNIIVSSTLKEKYGTDADKIINFLKSADSNDIPKRHDLLKHIMYSFYYDVQEFHKYDDLNSLVPNVSSNLKFENNRMILKENSPIVLDNIKNHYEISFNDILNTSDNITLVLENLIDRSMGVQEIEFIKTSISHYIECQDQKVLANPLSYLDDYKNRANSIINEIIG